MTYSMEYHPLDGMLVHLRVSPSIEFIGTQQGCNLITNVINSRNPFASKGSIIAVQQYFLDVFVVPYSCHFKN